MGDEVLKKLSEIFQTLIRSNDRIGRWGGEEFLILLPQTSYIQAKEMGKNLVNQLKGISKIYRCYENFFIKHTIILQNKRGAYFVKF